MPTPTAAAARPSRGWRARSPPGRPRWPIRALWAPPRARCSVPDLLRACGASRVAESILFARNLFLPEDLGGNRYPYETIRRLGARGHCVTVVTPRLHDGFPRLQGVHY